MDFLQRCRAYGAAENRFTARMFSPPAGKTWPPPSTTNWYPNHEIQPLTRPVSQEANNTRVSFVALELLANSVQKALGNKPVCETT